MVLSTEELTAIGRVYHSLVGGHGPPPRSLERVQDSWEALQAGVREAQEALAEAGTGPMEVPVRLSVEEWARVAAILKAYPCVVTPATRRIVEGALDRIGQDLDGIGVEPSLRLQDPADEVSTEPAYGPWIPEGPGPRQDELGEAPRALIFPQMGDGNLRGWEGVVLYDAGQVLLRRGVRTARLDEILAGVRCMFHLDLLIEERGLVGARQRLSFEAGLLEASLEVARDLGPERVNLLFEAVARLARAVESTGHRSLAHEVRDLVWRLPRDWLLAFDKEWEGEPSELWPGTSAPRNLLKRRLARDWHDLGSKERIDRVARALLFPFSHQHWGGQENLARWEEELFEFVAGFRGREQLRLEVAQAIYVRTAQLAEAGEAGKLTEGMWLRLSVPHFEQRWAKRLEGDRDD